MKLILKLIMIVCFRHFRNQYKINSYCADRLLNTVMICGLGPQMNSSLLPQDAVSSNLRKSGLKKPMVASSLKRQGKFPSPTQAAVVEGRPTQSRSSVSKEGLCVWWSPKLLTATLAGMKLRSFLSTSFKSWSKFSYVWNHSVGKIACWLSRLQRV